MTHARPSHTVPRSSTSVCKLSIKCPSVPINWPISSTRKTRRWSGPLESRYSLTHLQKFSTVSEKLFSALSIHFSADFTALAERLAKRLDDLISVEFVGISLVEPFLAGGLFIGGMEGRQLALAIQVAFHVGDVRVIADHSPAFRSGL